MINQIDLVRANDSKNLSLDNDCKSDSRTELPKKLKKSKRGFCDTPSIPVNTTVAPKMLLIKEDDSRIFVDFLTFFGSKLELNSYHENLIVELFLKGKFFLSKEHPYGEDELEIKAMDCGSQIHEGSPLKWSKMYRNSIGVVFKVAYSRDGKTNRVSGQLEELENPNKIIAISLEFSGKPLSFLVPRNNQISLVQMIEIILQLSKKIRVSRIDTTMEFSREKLDLFEVRKVIDNKDVIGLKEFSSYSGTTSKNVGRTCTCYFGSPKSSRLARIYDTEYKHGYGGIRYEVQNRREYADFVVTELMDIYKSAMRKVENMYHVCGKEDKLLHDIATDINRFIIDYNLSKKHFVLVDKKDKKRWKNRYQYKEFEFWSKFKDSFNVCELKYKFVRNPVPVKRSISFFTRNFSGLLCALYDVLGESLFNSFISHIIIAKKKGVGMTPYTGKEDKYLELEELASGGVIGICDEYLLAVLRQVGFFNKPCQLPKKNKKTFLDFENLRIEPQLVLGLEF